MSAHKIECVKKVHVLEITVHHIGGVHVLQRRQQLVSEVLDVLVAQGLWALDDLGKVCDGDY
jgi:hypothetical protein